jgi:pyrroloquinoline quinone biosynthesis protein B
LLTNADLDHTLGLLLLREGGRIPVYATARVRAALARGLSLPALLERYGGADWQEPPRSLQPLCSTDGSTSGLRVAAFHVPGKPPRYLEGELENHPDDNVGYRLVDERTGGRLLFVPDCSAVDDVLAAELSACDVLLLDGTFWSEDEMLPLGGRSASAMAHLPVGGPNGSLAQIAKLPIPRKIYLHVNNTNPLLLPESAERASVIAAGMEIGEDGMDLTL